VPLTQTSHQDKFLIKCTGDSCDSKDFQPGPLRPSCRYNRQASRCSVGIPDGSGDYRGVRDFRSCREVAETDKPILYGDLRDALTQALQSNT
jgi:hypothetical protein